MGMNVASLVAKRHPTNLVRYSTHHLLYQGTSATTPGVQMREIPPYHLSG
jgi:hypothetical protein